MAISYNFCKHFAIYLFIINYANVRECNSVMNEKLAVNSIKIKYEITPLLKATSCVCVCLSACRQLKNKTKPP